MEDELQESLRPYLTRAAEDDALLAYTRVYPEDDQAHQRSIRQLLDIPTYKLNPGIGLLQLATSCSFEVLSEFLFFEDGVIIQMSTDLCVVVTYELDTSVLVKARDKTRFVPIGPVFESFVRVEKERDDLAVCGLYVRQTSIPFGKELLTTIKETLSIMLRFVTSLRLPSRVMEKDFSRRLVLHVFDGRILLEDIFSAEYLRSSFLRDDWKERGHLSLDSFSPSYSEWLALEVIPFECVKVLRSTVPWRFFQKTKSASVQFINRFTKLERPLGSASPSSTTTLMLKCWSFGTAREVEELCQNWFSLSRNVVMDHSHVTAEAWQHLWCSSALHNRTLWTSITISNWRIDGELLNRKHLDAIPLNRAWTISWHTCDEEEKLGTLRVRRTEPSLLHLPHLRPNDSSPLLSDAPPTDAQQSLVLATMLQAQDDPDKLFKLLRAYCNMLRTPRTATARFHDLETSIIELRALCMEHRAGFDLLMEVMSAQQLQHARELQEVRVWAQCMMEEQVEELEERLGRQQNEMRTLAAEHRHHVQALMELNRSLESRLLSLEEKRDQGS